MRESIAVTALAIAALALSGAAEKPQCDETSTRAGAELHLEFCAACHGRDARGNGPAAVAFTKRPADLTGIAARHGGVFPEAEVARFIDGRSDLAAHGSREMPVWGRFFGAEATSSLVRESIARANIAALVEYLKSIQRIPASGPAPAPAPQPE